MSTLIISTYVLSPQRLFYIGTEKGVYPEDISLCMNCKY